MTIKSLLQGLGIGAGLMYLWDPQNGRRRRAELLDQVDHAKHSTEDFVDKARRDLRNRIAGTTAEARARLISQRPDDHTLTERVRAKIGRYCSHPRAIEVQANDGHVLLRGQILLQEVEGLLKAVRWVRGVRGVEDQLEPHRERGNISALQGGVPRPGERYDFRQETWSPATQAIGQLAGLALMANCVARRNVSSIVLGTIGFGLFVRARTNQSLAQLTGRESASPVHFQRSVLIDAPVEKVWDFVSDFQQVAKILPSVESLQDLGEGHYRWDLRLPSGQQMQLEERVTETVPEQRLSWESVTDQPVWYRGSVSLQPDRDDATRVDIHIRYIPPGGALGRALASFWGMDAESQFQQAVMRIKPYLESHHPDKGVRPL